MLPHYFYLPVGVDKNFLNERIGYLHSQPISMSFSGSKAQPARIGYFDCGKLGFLALQC